ncbi:MAG: metal-dependent phosphohydrolase [Gammaproteobacteria bacterium]|uniref:heme biosynthesis HemY N-terminal domain-containing protein n=1 Tax=Pseudomaricurvus alcaniphilus TaxID=1166482 RepID=UPI001407A0FC|nr:heme biosynthesis HemY N-terminal domain-containing protein [Pseudomaricurvus alcaniphilus]MBR9909874.1 metal-dependent phosphohydrolase [Gammaproteobacteria bacterium]NHN38600.1 metal-dependent phosphohydrolase [Pseudomaricurvus alcaniphilus]
MIMIFILFVLFVFGGAWLYQLAATKPGYLLLVIGDTSIEMSIWFALAVLLLATLLGLLVWRLLHGGVRGVGTQMSRLFVGSEERAQRQMSRGFIHFFEGNWRQALHLLKRSATRSPTPLLNYLGAARSAYELGEIQQANDLLARAEEETPAAALSVILSQAKMQFVAKKYEQCAATLERGRKLAPKNPVVLDLLSQVYMRLQDWQSLAKILPTLEQHSLLAASEVETISATVYRQLMLQAGQSKSLESINQAWKNTPKQWQHNADLLLIYVDLLDAAGEANAAEVLLRKTLKKYWDNRLVLRYGTLQTSDAMRQLLKAEGWLQERPGNADLLLTLGRLCLRNHLWGKARDYFASSLKIKAGPAAYAEMARLLAHLGEHEKSTEFYQKGLLLAAEQLPDLPMPERKTA